MGSTDGNTDKSTVVVLAAQGRGVGIGSARQHGSVGSMVCVALHDRARHPTTPASSKSSNSTLWLRQSLANDSESPSGGRPPTRLDYLGPLSGYKLLF